MIWAAITTYYCALALLGILGGILWHSSPCVGLDCLGHDATLYIWSWAYLGVFGFGLVLVYFTKARRAVDKILAGTVAATVFGVPYAISVVLS
jgi:hypothetical protein